MASPGNQHCASCIGKHSFHKGRTADGPRDALRESKSCQLLHNGKKTSWTTNPEIEVMD